MDVLPNMRTQEACGLEAEEWSETAKTVPEVLRADRGKRKRLHAKGHATRRRNYRQHGTVRLHPIAIPLPRAAGEEGESNST